MVRSTVATGVVALACLVVATPGAAQRARPHFGVGASATLPMGSYHADQFGDGFNTGWQGLAFLAVKSPRRLFGWRIDFTYGENPANDQLEADVSAQVGQPVQASMKMLGVSLDLVLGTPRARGAEAYVLGGVGAQRATLSAQTDGATSDTSESRFAWNVGGGITRAGGGIAPFVEARYVHVAEAFDISSLPFVTITAGLRF